MILRGIRYLETNLFGGMLGWRLKKIMLNFMTINGSAFAIIKELNKFTGVSNDY